MIEKEITFSLNASKQNFLMTVSSPLNLSKFWMFLKEIKILNETEYIAKFKVFMNFNFRMRRILLPNGVIHEGVMDFPRAIFRFHINVFQGKKELFVTVKGEYQGPLEFLAKTPMKMFLENFRDKIIAYYEKRQQSFTVQELFKKLNDDSKNKTIEAEIEFNSRTYTLVFKDGKLDRILEDETNDVLIQLLTYTGFLNLIREDEVYEEEFDNLDELLKKLRDESKDKEIVARIEVNDKKYTLIVKNGKIMYSELDPNYKGKLKLIDVDEK